MLIEHKVAIAWIYAGGRLCNVDIGMKELDFLVKITDSNKALTVKEQSRLRAILQKYWEREPKK